MRAQAVIHPSLLLIFHALARRRLPRCCDRFGWQLARQPDYSSAEQNRFYMFQPPAKNFGFTASESWKVLTSKDSDFTLPKNGDFNAQMLHVYPCILPLYHYLPTKLRDLWGKCSNICQHYGPAPGAGWLGPGASWQGAVEGFWLGDPRVTIGWKILPCSRLT